VIPDRLRLTTVDTHRPREALVIHVARWIDADATVAVLDRIAASRATTSRFIRCDNDPELTAYALRDWCRLATTGTPSSPVRRGRTRTSRASRAGWVTRSSTSTRSTLCWMPGSWSRTGGSSTTPPGPTARLATRPGPSPPRPGPPPKPHSQSGSTWSTPSTPPSRLSVDHPTTRHPEQAERWTWLVLAAYTQLRLARAAVADRRLPWERSDHFAPVTGRSAAGFRGCCPRSAHQPPRRNPPDALQAVPRAAAAAPPPATRRSRSP
jgi:hypothetical protein